MALIEHLEKLRHFVRVTQFRSIREAAQSSGISQAGLSKSISSLEDVLETKLFLRSPGGLSLTKEGQEVLVATNNILNEATQLETRLRSLKSAQIPKKLRIGMYDSIAVYFGAELSRYIEAIYPSVRLEITADTSASLLARLKDEKLDLAIGVNYDQVTTKKLKFFKLFNDHYSFYVSPKILKFADTAPLLIHETAFDEKGISVESHLKSEIKERGFHHILNFETLKAMALQGFGVGVLPTQVAKPLVHIDQLVSVQISKKKHLFGQHTIGFLASESLIESYGDFIKDIYRLGEQWSKR